MIVITIFKDNAGIANLTSAITFESCKRRLKLYFSGLEEVKKRLLSGEIVSIPYLTLQGDRRIKEKKVKIERRKTGIPK